MIQSLAKLIPAEGEIMLLDLVGRIGKLRALTEDESALVEAIVRRQTRRTPVTYRRWTRDEDHALIAAGQSRGGIRSLANSMGLDQYALWRRYYRLRNSFNSAKSCERIEG